MAATKNPQKAFSRELKRATRQLTEACPHLGKWIGTYGPCSLEIEWERDLYQSLVEAIAHQQLHGRAAQTILGRLRAGFQNEFPTPAQLARARTEKLRAMGFSNAKTIAIQGVAKAAKSGFIPSRAEALKLSDDELRERLVQLHGVGAWTVEMLLIFTLGRMAVMPVDDFGVKSGLRLLLELPDMPKKVDFEKHTTHWKPYRSIGAWYLWRRVEAERKPKE